MNKEKKKENVSSKKGSFSITEIKEILDALSQSEEKFRQLQENIPIGLYQTSPEGNFAYVNKWVAKILKYDSPDELLKKNTYDLYANPEVRTALIKSLSEKGMLEDTEVQLKCKDNTLIWAVISAKTVYDNSTPLYFDGYIYNITERKKALEKLQDSEQLFRVISDNLKSALYVFNQEGHFEYVNPAMTEITGYSTNELLKKKFFEIVHPDYLEIVKKRGYGRIEGRDIPKTYELKLSTKSGAVKWIEISASRSVFKGNPVVVGLGVDISEHKNAIEIIKQSEQKYKTLYSFFRLMSDNVEDMIWAKDLNGKYIFANKTLCDKLLIAKSVEEPIGKNDQFFIERERKKYPDRKDWHTFGDLSGNTDKIIIKNKKPQRFDEYGNVKGRFLFLDVIKAPLWDENGHMIGTVGSARDVTKEREIEEERHRFEKLQAVMYRISAASGTTSDLKELITVIRGELGTVIDTTNFFVALYDSEKDEISLPFFADEKDHFTIFPKGKSLTSLVIKQKKSMLLKSENFKELEDSGLIDPLGTESKIWLGVPLVVKDNILGALVVQNYHDEKAFTKIELELMEYVSSQIGYAISQKQADEELKESEKRLRQIIDTVPHMVFAKDKSGTFILANKATADAYGLSVKEVEGQKQADLHRIYEEVLKFEYDDKLILENNEPSLSTEDLFTDSEGEEHLLQTIKIPLQFGNHKGLGILGVAIDITESKKSAVELKFAKEKAEESDRLKTAFLANMSHEIRTPMNAIIGFSELLNDSEITVDTRKEFIGLISESSKLLLNLIEDIIDVAKIEAEQMKIMKSSCHVNQVLDELASYFNGEQKRAFNSKITIKAIKSNPNPKFAIVTDPLRFKQVMNNLIGNALKFTHKGTVEFGYEVQNDKIIQFYIKDTGIGLPHDKLGIIFERFRQAEESTTKEYGGTGLGLTISRKLIELLGGTIWVESELNVGSTFYFTLPYILPKINGRTKPFTGLSDKYDWSGKTIVVAEDENSNFELLKAILSRTNVRVFRAHNGKEAVELCLMKEIDLVLMDIRMPEMNGYEATEIIKSHFPNLPVISLTAYAMADDREKSLQVGCDDHISKPIKPVELIERVSRFMK